MKQQWLKLVTLWRLGLPNLVRVAKYRKRVHSGYFNRILSVTPLVYDQPIFTGGAVCDALPLDATCGEQFLQGQYNYFFHASKQVGQMPNWFLNPFTGYDWSDTAKQHWSRVGYFVAPGEDIKCVWELSRFYWAVDLAVLYRSGNDAALNHLNHCLGDWLVKNPVNAGVNWLCAQEASIRLTNFLLAVVIAGQACSTTIEAFCAVHVKRILPTVGYARGQCNNHATSEAFALFFAGSYLIKHAVTAKLKAEAIRWRDKGQKMLECLLSVLVASDGTFSQYSVTYHRMVLDTVSLAVYCERYLNAPRFSSKFYKVYEKLTQWLAAMTDLTSHDAINMGSNDGTLLFKLDACDYRDFRPSLQLASCFLYGKRAFVGGGWDQPLLLLNIPLPNEVGTLPCQVSQHFSAGGYARLQLNQTTWAMINYPMFRFRPSQNDAMHIDVWHEGCNVFHDAGTFSYNPINEADKVFSSVVAHNTVQFDRHEQMPRLSRFLLGGWLRSACVKFAGNFWCGKYRDVWGGQHFRHVRAGSDQILVVDQLKGVSCQAILRWHSPLLDWQQVGSGWQSNKVLFTVEMDGDVVVPQVEKALYSRYYLDQAEGVVFEVVIPKSAQQVITKIVFQ